MQRHHTHDCDRCTLLGAIAGPRGPVDLYRCDSKPGRGGKTYLARFSSDGPDYSSCDKSFLEACPQFSPYAQAALALDKILSLQDGHKNEA